MKAIKILETVMEFDDDPRTKQYYQDAISELKDLESYIEKQIEQTKNKRNDIAQGEYRAYIDILHSIKGEQ